MSNNVWDILKLLRIKSLIKPKDSLERWLLYSPIVALIATIPTVVMWTLYPEVAYLYEIGLLPKYIMSLSLNCSSYIIFYLWLFIFTPLSWLCITLLLVYLKRKCINKISPSDLTNLITLTPLGLCLAMFCNDTICLIVYLILKTVPVSVSIFNLSFLIIFPIITWLAWRWKYVKNHE